MKVGIYQGGNKSGVSENLALLERIVVNSHESHKLDLIIFPELFLNGWASSKDLRTSAEYSDGPSFRKISDLAKQHKVGIAYGYSERVEGTENLFNSAMLVDKEGKNILNYRKTHSWGTYEKSYFKNGDELSPVVEFEGWKVALLICFDVEFPETCRALALNGAELLIVPTALASSFNAKITVVSRAFENLCFLCYANRVGPDYIDDLKKNINFCGLSVIVGPNGDELARASESNEELIVATLNKNEERFENNRINNPYFDDRRPALYSSLTSIKYDDDLFSICVRK